MAFRGRSEPDVQSRLMRDEIAPRHQDVRGPRVGGPSDHEVARTTGIADEQLRQERIAFDQRKRQDDRWFLLRLAMGWSAVLLLPAIGGLSGWIVTMHSEFPAETVALASSALFVDSIGLMLAVWRIVLGGGPGELAPLTRQTEEPQPRTSCETA